MGFRVLIVEDNPDGANSLAVFLRMSGFDVQVTYGGREGVEAALADPPDAILCDIQMPEVDGFAVARRGGADALPDPPLLIAVTARREQDILRPAGEAGFDHYFIKPADPVEIGGLLSEYADGEPVPARPLRERARRQSLTRFNTNRNTRLPAPTRTWPAGRPPVRRNRASTRPCRSSRCRGPCRRVRRGRGRSASDRPSGPP